MRITLYRYLLFFIVPLIFTFLTTYGANYAIKKPLLNNSIDFSVFSIDFNDNNIKFAAFDLNVRIYFFLNM